MRKRNKSDRRKDAKKKDKPGKSIFRGSPPSSKQKFDVHVSHKNTLVDILQSKIDIKPSEASIIPDPWQIEVNDHLNNGFNVVVDAPTSAGKTQCIEMYFRDNLKTDLSLESPRKPLKACFTTPVKSLANDKFIEFREKFGSQNVGITTGDLKENLSAPIIVATLESYRNTLLGNEPDLSRSIVIFDEYHFLNDSSRGSAWEEAIILTPPKCHILMLSASVGNPEDVASWIQKIKQKKCHMVTVAKRPVPLENMVYYRGKWLLEKEISGVMSRNPNTKSYSRPMSITTACQRIMLAKAYGLTPTLVYYAKRSSCEIVAKEFAKNAEGLRPSESTAVLFNELMDKYTADSYFNPVLRNYILKYNFAYHHSGLTIKERLVIEGLLKEGKIDFCIATMGLSLGINFGVKSACIGDFSRPSDDGLIPYPQEEVLQMLGRAGRRGKDKKGYSLWISENYYKKMANAHRVPLQSSLKKDITTFLGLVEQNYSMTDITDFYSQSFLKHQIPATDFTLITPERILKRTKSESLPCQNPAYEFDRFIHDEDSKCNNCHLKENCHDLIYAKTSGSLSALQLHLMRIGAINNENKLTDFGNVARFFPQPGGLIVAREMLNAKGSDADILDKVLHHMACFSLAYYKKPMIGENSLSNASVSRKSEKEMQKLFAFYYPMELFPEYYDSYSAAQDQTVFKEYNPEIANLIFDWIDGSEWKDLEKAYLSKSLSSGDMMNAVFRFSSFLNSLINFPNKEWQIQLRSIKKRIMREPFESLLDIHGDDDDEEDEIDEGFSEDKSDIDN